MKQAEKDFLAKFIAGRKDAIELEYKKAVDQAVACADLARKTWLEVHRFELLQGAPFDVLTRFAEKIKKGYELVGRHDEFWPEVAPNGFLSIPLIVPIKKLQKHANEYRQTILEERLNLARLQRDAALAAIEQEAFAALEAERAKVIQVDTAAEIRRLMGNAIFNLEEGGA